MNNCLLCQENKADKTRSHIIPSFLMKRINGDGKRDHEIGFEINNGIVNTYFGRDIYEDKRKSITDSEEKIYSKENYDVKDYVFCKDCEDYFASLESKYAQSLNLHFSEESNTKNTKVSPSDALLFWCSLIWRASVTNFLGNRLNSDLEERLRYALVNNNIDNINIKYALFRCKDYSKNTGRGTSVYMDIKDKNVVLFVDEFILAMIFDMKYEMQEIKLSGINLTLKQEKLNDGKRVEEISPIPSHVFSQLLNSIILVMVKSMQLPDRIKDLHTKIFGGEIPQIILKEIQDMILNTGKIGDRYTIEHYAWCYKEVLKKHKLIIENEDGTLIICK